jgi:hypothetical protein
VPARQIYERLFVHETIVDVLLEIAEVREAVKTGWLGRGHLYALRAKQRSVEHRSVSLTRMVDEVYRLLGEASVGAVVLDEQVVALARRLKSVLTAVAATKAELDRASLRSPVDGWYDEVEAAWSECQREQSGPWRRRTAGKGAPRKVLAEMAQTVYVGLDSASEGEDEGYERRREATDYLMDSQEEGCSDDEVERE